MISLVGSLSNMSKWQHEAKRIETVGKGVAKDLHTKCENLEETLRAKKKECVDLLNENEKLKSNINALNKTVEDLNAAKLKTATKTATYSAPYTDPRIKRRDSTLPPKHIATESTAKVVETVKTPTTQKETYSTSLRDLMNQIIANPIAPPVKKPFDYKSLSAPSTSAPTLIESIKSSAPKADKIKSKPSQKNTKSFVTFVEPIIPISPLKAHSSATQNAEFTKTSSRRTPQPNQKRPQQPAPAEDRQQNKKKKGKRDSSEGQHREKVVQGRQVPPPLTPL